MNRFIVMVLVGDLGGGRGRNNVFLAYRNGLRGDGSTCETIYAVCGFGPTLDVQREAFSLRLKW